MRVPIPLIGPSYHSRSLPVSAQVTKNLYPEVNPEGKNIVSLHAFPGLKEFADVTDVATINTAGPDRGLYVMDGELFAFNGEYVVAIGPDGGVDRQLGPTIPGSDRMDFADNGTKIAVATGFALFYIEKTSGVDVFRVTDADVSAPSTVTYLNSQFIMDDDEGFSFKTSQLTGPLSVSDFVNGADEGAADAYPGRILRAVTFNQMVYFFCTDSMEPYYNSGVGNPPFDRVNSGIRKSGLAGRWAIAVDDDAIFYLDDTRTPRVMNGFEPANIGNTALGKEFNSYSTVADALATVFTVDNQKFFKLDFPTANRSWCWHQPSNFWFQLSSGVDDEMHLGGSYAYCYGKHLFAHPTNAKIYELDFDTFTDAGVTVQRQRATANIHGGLYGAPGAELIFDSVWFDIETGVGIESGQGSDPMVMIRYSDDSGRTWSAEQQHQLGAAGEYLYRVELHQQGRAYNRVYELTYSDPTRFSLIGASADIEVAA